MGAIKTMAMGKGRSALRMGFQYAMDARPLLRRVNRADKRALRNVGKMIRRDARASIKRAPALRRRDRAGRYAKSTSRARSAAGHPPYSRTGNLRASIGYAVGKHTVWIGAKWPRGAHGSMLEHGTRRAGKRAFMGPARKRVEPVLVQKWRNKL